MAGSPRSGKKGTCNLLPKHFVPEGAIWTMDVPSEFSLSALSASLQFNIDNIPATEHIHDTLFHYIHIKLHAAGQSFRYHEST